MSKNTPSKNPRLRQILVATCIVAAIACVTKIRESISTGIEGCNDKSGLVIKKPKKHFKSTKVPIDETEEKEKASEKERIFEYMNPFEGDECYDDSDCFDMDLPICHKGWCEAPTKPGSPCLKDLDCNGELICNKANPIDRHTGSCQLPQEAGEPCSKKSDCAQDLTCTNKKSSKKFFGIEGTCEAPREEGERCFKNNECEGGLICSDHECKAKQETGSLCETEHSENYDNYSPHADCADGYLCNDKITDEYGRSTCQPVETPGSKCYEGPWGTKLDCPEGQTCHSDSYNNFWGSCAPISEEDESCEADDDCFGDLKCRTETGSRTKSCQQPIQQGKPCNQETNFSGCDDGLVCMNKSSTCEPPSKEAGSACADNNECGQGLSCQEWENQCQPKQGEGGLCYDHADCKQGLACGDTADNSPVSTCFDPNNVEELNCHNYDDESLMALKQEIIEVDVQSIIEEAGKHKAYFLQNLFGVVPIIKYRIYSIENPEHIRNELCVGLNNLNMDLNYSDQLPIIIENEMLKVKNNPELMGIINENADQIHSLIQILRSLGNVNSESEISPWLITLAELFEELLD